MNTTDIMRKIERVEASAPARLRLHWSSGETVELDLAEWLNDTALATLRNPGVFSQVSLGDWGHSLDWPDDVQLGADSLWLETLSALGRTGPPRPEPR